VDSKSLVFLSLISGPRQYRIPSFQRAYSWEKEDRETLWLDLLTQYEILHHVWDRSEAERDEELDKRSTHYLVIAIETKNNDDTNAIFESLNGKGRPLTQLDLLRNYVFMTLGSRADQVLKDEWLPIEHTHLPDRKDMEAFVWADVVSRGTNVLQKRTYRTIQSEIREAGASSSAAEAYVKRLKRRAPVFSQIIDPSQIVDHDLKAALDRLSRAGGKTARPLVLWLFEEEVNDRCEKSDVVLCINHIESFLARRFLCALAPNNLNSMFGIMLSRLNSPTGALRPRVGTVEERLLTGMMSVPKDFPDDSAVQEGVLAHDFYHNGDTRLRTHIMRSLDKGFGYDLMPGYDESDRSIEHILPQTKNANPWIADLKSLGEELAVVQDRWLHTLGNLTIVSPSDNSSLGAKRFPEKADIFRGLGYKMTQAVLTFATERAGELLWGAAAIEARAKDLAERATETWPRPESAPLSLDTPATQPDGVEFDDDVDEIVPFTSSIDESESDAEEGEAGV